MTWWDTFRKTVEEGNNEQIKSMINEVSIKKARDKSGSNLLHYVTDNEIITRQLIDDGCNVNKINRYGETPLLTAVQSNKLNVAKMLLDAGAIIENINCNADFGPLHTAVCFAFVDMVKMLIEAGVDVNTVDEENSTPLHLAAKLGTHSLTIAKLLMDAGADINAVDYQAASPLHWALLHGNFELVYALLEAGVCIEVMDESFVTPLHLAVRVHHADLTRRFLEAGADVDMVDCHGRTSLHLAVRFQNLETAELLLKAGATPNCTDGKGYSPLHWAVEENNIQFVKLLLEYGADVNIQDEEDTEGRSALMVASDCSAKDIILFLLENGADVKAKCNRGYNVLYYAAASRRKNPEVDDDLYSDILAILLAHGAEIGESSHDIQTPIASILVYGNQQAVQLLIENGIDLTKCTLKKNKISSLHQATLNDDHKVLEYLIKSNLFDIEETFSVGVTALHLAAFTNKPKGILLLLSAGANIDNPNIYNETPLYSAVLKGHTLCASILMDAGADINILTEKKKTILHRALETDESYIIYDIIRRIAKLEAAGRPVVQENFDLIKEYEDLQDQYETCKTELALMQGAIVHASVTIFDILTASDIGSYARNKHIISTFEQQKLCDFFPVYYDQLVTRFENERQRQVLMKSAMAGMSHIFKCDADTFHDIFYNIFRHLDRNDLRNLQVV